MITAVVIPFRDRGIDPLRKANLERVKQNWQTYCQVNTRQCVVVDDGRGGNEQFNRSAAYNFGIGVCPSADVFVFAESDMLIDFDQIDEAVVMARVATGLVVPFDKYAYLSPKDSARVRTDDNIIPGGCRPAWTMEAGSSIGAINVVSRRTLERIGQFDEKFEGSWYDDDAMKLAFEMAAGPTRWVPGWAFHLYHLPGHQGQHLTDADRAATERNKTRLQMYRAANTPDRIRELTGGAR